MHSYIHTKRHIARMSASLYLPPSFTSKINEGGIASFLLTSYRHYLRVPMIHHIRTYVCLHSSPKWWQYYWQDSNNLDQQPPIQGSIIYIYDVIQEEHTQTLQQQKESLRSKLLKLKTKGTGQKGSASLLLFFPSLSMKDQSYGDDSFVNSVNDGSWFVAAT